MTFPETWKQWRVMFSHDWLTGMRGGERVLEVLCRGFPSAPIHTLIYRKGQLGPVIEDHPIRTSWLQRVPGIMKFYRYFLPFFPHAIERFRPPESDLVISTSHCVAKGIRPQGATKHLCYCFTPMRYAWTFYDEYFGTHPLKKLVLKPPLARLKRWDVAASDRVDLFVAISEHVAKRIRRFYDRDPEIVYPPVDTERCRPGSGRAGDFDLMVSALVPYKRVDLAVSAYTRLGYPLKIVGTGTEYERLRKAAGPNVEFLGWKTDEEIVALYQACRQLVFPGEEDFGIVPLEVQACGRPVVAYGRGGVLETVLPGTTGVFFEKQSEEALLNAVEEAADRTWAPSVIRANAERFDVQNFIDGMDRSIQKVLSLGSG